MTDLKCRLLIPQDNFMVIQILKKPKISFTVTWENSILELYEQVHIMIKYDQTTHLSMLHDYNSIYRTSESLAITGCVTSEKNQNLAHL